MPIQKKQISLYFHIPFCSQKCDYCHFYVLPDKDLFKQQLMEGLELEWKKILPLLSDAHLVSIYFGGGTPSLLGVESLAKILSWIEKEGLLNPEAEITLEANPENVNLPLMKGYARAGINRLSLGIQTFDPELLKILRRTHTTEKALRAVEEVSEAGIKNISVDLMYDIPYQTFDQWAQTLQQAVQLPITHLSFYNLTIEPHTSFYKRRAQLRKALPDPETSLAMLTHGIEYLSSHGLQRYEISAFARQSCYSRHNLGYWTARPFLGLGPSAFSYWEKERFRNIAHLGKYLEYLRKNESPIDFREKLKYQEHLQELLAVELRLMKGVNLAEFQSRHGNITHVMLETLQDLVESELLQKHGDIFTLTEKGKNFYDTVASELVGSED
ncbi:radical SAM family heme chaperone HemW [Parachlamydia sp. AcF125]|uniref:radical SAM family heme chaperone HemW n=1 Tax=Parachlamydia sp. AcF125 TaxID=2795736 RepID=UPI001BC9C0BE|nr:radical SAM family heme chaperone HemW [Parachlamydia sp. AcF125]MBS4168296.1 Oxygen-independent coproporphyrinogen-III oxidase-like protein YqeR [Parachlamydia sp. AcF125]